MRSRRLACFFIGVWLGGCVLMAWLTTDSFRSVDRMLLAPAPAAAAQLQGMGADAARKLFRYQVSEQNRAAFRTWEIAQLFFGAAFFLYLLFGTKEGKLPMILVLLMLAIVVMQRMLFTPALIVLGRHLDFASALAAARQRQEFWIVHNAYSIAEVIKWGVGVGLAVRLSFGRGSGRSRDSRKKLDVIDKSNYGHINR